MVVAPHTPVNLVLKKTLTAATSLVARCTGDYLGLVTEQMAEPDAGRRGR